jgi:Cys-tRNA(Pro)/Cys-tRNA(Cys) deacylase
MSKTNALRILDLKGIIYSTSEYEVSEDELDAVSVAHKIGAEPETVFKTLVLPTTGYIRGGCSPIGMKKLFPTFIDETAQLYDEIFVSPGVRGMQVKLSPLDLKNAVGAEFADLV